MNAFDTAAVLLAIAALCGYLNHRLLRLPAMSGTLAVALISSAGLVAVETLAPGWGLGDRIAGFLKDIDFNRTLMRGLLSFLLFAAALHVDLDALWQHKWTIGILSTVGVIVSTAVVGGLTWAAFAALGIPIPLPVCLIFGALISPTDPVAVMGLLRELRAPASLEAQIAGESLFNDGVGVVIFLGLVSLASPPGSEGATHVAGSGMALVGFFVREVAGGLAVGLGLGYLGYYALKSIDEHPLELLITLALAMGVYSTALQIHVSAPIAVVVAGLLIGNPGRRHAMSVRTREHVDAFWILIDYVLNAVLFLLIALEVFSVPQGWTALRAGLAAIPIVLIARTISVALPVFALRRHGNFMRGMVPILTWSGLRGGISVALVLSLPPFPDKHTVLAATYAVVVFSILVQGLTMRRVLAHYGVGTPAVVN